MCRDWAAALATGVLPSLTLTCDDPHGMWEWLAQSHLQPAALHITGTPELSLENDPMPALVARFATRATVGASSVEPGASALGVFLGRSSGTCCTRRPASYWCAL